MFMSRKKIAPPAVAAANTSKEYWEQVLQKAGLSMDAGLHRFRVGSERPYREVHVGNSHNLEDIHEMQMGQNGRVRPKGAGPDEDKE